MREVPRKSWAAGFLFGFLSFMVVLLMTGAVPATLVTFTPGTVISSSDINGNFTKLYTPLNGNIDCNNLADNAVGTSEISATAVTNGKLGALGTAGVHLKAESTGVTNSQISEDSVSVTVTARDLVPSADSSKDLGASGKKWNSGYINYLRAVGLYGPGGSLPTQVVDGLVGATDGTEDLGSSSGRFRNGWFSNQLTCTYLYLEPTDTTPTDSTGTIFADLGDDRPYYRITGSWKKFLLDGDVAAGVSGSGTAGYVAKWSSTSAIGNGTIQDASNAVTVTNNIVPGVTGGYDFGSALKMWGSGFFTTLYGDTIESQSGATLQVYDHLYGGNGTLPSSYDLRGWNNLYSSGAITCSYLYPTPTNTTPTSGEGATFAYDADAHPYYHNGTTWKKMLLDGDVAAGGVSGSGTVGKIPLWSGSTTNLSDSAMTEGSSSITSTKYHVATGIYPSGGTGTGSIGGAASLWGNGYFTTADIQTLTAATSLFVPYSAGNPASSGGLKVNSTTGKLAYHDGSIAYALAKATAVPARYLVTEPSYITGTGSYTVPSALMYVNRFAFGLTEAAPAGAVDMVVNMPPSYNGGDITATFNYHGIGAASGNMYVVSQARLLTPTANLADATLGSVVLPYTSSATSQSLASVSCKITGTSNATLLQLRFRRDSADVADTYAYEVAVSPHFYIPVKDADGNN